MRPSDSDPALSPEAILVIQALVGSAASKGTVDLPDERALTRFAAGLANGEDRDSIVAALTRSPELRERLLVLRAYLRAQAEVPLGTEEDSVSVVRREAVQAALGVFGSLRRWCLERGWEAVERATDAESKMVRGALASIGRAVRTAIPPRLALARGGDDRPELDGHLPAGIDPRLELEIDEVGALHAVVRFSETVAGTLSALDGRRLDLEMIDPAGGTVALATGQIAAARWHALVPGFREATGLETGDLLPVLFRLSVGNGPRVDVARRLLYAAVLSPTGKPQGDEAPFEIFDEIRVEAQSLVVTLLAPSETRRRYAAYDLQLRLPVGNLDQLLGRWPLRDWGEEPRTLRIPLPGAHDGRFDCSSVLLLSLAPSVRVP